MATQLLVAGIETREEYANVSSAIAKGTCAKQDRNVNHTIINDTSRKRDGPFRSKSSTLITLSNLEFWNFHPIEAVQLSPSYLSTNVTIFYKSASVKSDMLNLTICRNYNESCPIKPLDAARHKAIAELRGPSHASKYSLIIIARTRFNVSSYVALPAAISFSTLPYDFPVAGDFTNVLSASNTELNLTNVTVSWRMSDRDFVEATPLAFFIVTLEIPGGKRYVLCVNSTFVTLNNLRRFAFFSLAVTPMFEVDGAIYSGLSSRYNFTTEARFPTPSDVMLHVVDFNSDTIAYQVTWALQPYKKVKPHDTRITICKVSLCESFKSNLTSYALSVGYQEDVLVTVETDYVLPDGQVISRNKTHRIKAPPSEPFAVWGIKSAITATGADSAVYTFNWKGYKPRSSKFPQLAYFALRACKNANVSCWYYSTLETFYSLPLKFKEKYEVAVSAVYELLPHQLTNKTVMLKITVPEQSELSSHIGQVKKGYISLPLWVAIFIPLIMLTFAVAVTVHQLYIHCHDDSDRIIRPETVSMTPSDENLTESQENTYQRKQTKKTKQSAIKSRSEPPERTR